jgi:hypothetical protein
MTEYDLNLAICMNKAFRIVIPSPSFAIPSRARNLVFCFRVNSVRNLVFSKRDCHVAPLLAMTVLKESLNLGAGKVILR